MNAITTLIYFGILISLAVCSFILPPILGMPYSPWPILQLGYFLFIWLVLMLLLNLKQLDNRKVIGSNVILICCLVLAAYLVISVVTTHSLVNNLSSFANRFKYALSFYDLIAVLGIGYCCYKATTLRKTPKVAVQYLTISTLIMLPLLLTSFLNLWVPFFILTSIEKFETNLWISQTLGFLALIFFWFNAKISVDRVVIFIVVPSVFFTQIFGIMLMGYGSFWVYFINQFSEFNLGLILVFTVPLFSIFVVLGLKFTAKTR